MPKHKLTAKLVERWPSTEKRIEVADTQALGLYLIVQPSGSKSWAFRGRRDGRNYKLTLGHWPNMQLADARAAALAHANAPTVHLDGCTVTEAAERYITQHLSTLRTGRALERTVRSVILPAIGSLQLAEVRKSHVVEMLDAVKARAPVQANRAYALTGTLFKWCVERDLLSASPMVGVSKPTRERERDRVLTDTELKALWRAFTLYGWPFGSACKLMLLTAQRRGEVSGMRWQDLSDAEWHLSAEQTKNGKQHTVALSTQALALIAELPRLKGDYVFRSMRGNFAATSWSQAKLKFDALSGVSDWRIHDLRRTAATGMARLGTRPDVIKRALNHDAGDGITAIYNRYSYADELRDALQRWADLLYSIVH